MFGKIMKGVRGISLLFFFVCVPLDGHAIERPAATPQEPMTLSQAIKTALDRNPNVISRLEGIQAAESVRKQARSEFLFKANVSYNYTRMNEVPTTRLNIPGFPSEIPVGTIDNYNFQGTIKQPIFAGFSIITNYELAKLGVDISRVQFKTTKLTLIHDVTVAYFSILFAQKQLVVAEDAVTQLKSQVKRAKDFFEVGMTPKNDYLKAEVELANATQTLIVARNTIRLAEANFNTLLRMPVDSAVTVEDILKYTPYKMPLDKAYESAHENRPELVEAELTLKGSRKQVKLAESGYYPKVFVSFNYTRFGDTPALQGSDFQDQETWNVVAGLDWTFWEWGRTKFAVEERQHIVEQSKESMKALQDQVDLEVKNSYILLRNAEENIDVSEKAIEQAKENYRMEVERYKQQVNTNTDVLEAQTLVAQSWTNYYGALYNYNTALTDLKRAMGIIE